LFGHQPFFGIFVVTLQAEYPARAVEMHSQVNSAQRFICRATFGEPL